MEETAQPSSEPAAAPVQEATTGLDAVYKEFGIEEQAASFQPQSPAPAPAPQAPTPGFKVPDPFDPNFSAYQAQLAQGVSTLHQALSQTRNEFNSLQKQLQSQKVEADIKKAVGVISENAKLDPDIAEVALEQKARKDPRFLQVWNNRDKNPKAFEAALKAVGAEFAQRFTVRQDPQLVENQRAVAASRQAMATTSKASAQDEWADMTPSERQAKVRMMMRLG